MHLTVVVTVTAAPVAAVIRDLTIAIHHGTIVIINLTTHTIVITDIMGMYAICLLQLLTYSFIILSDDYRSSRSSYPPVGPPRWVLKKIFFLNYLLIH